MIIGSMMLRESQGIDIVRVFQWRASEVGELLWTSRALLLRQNWRVSGLVLALLGLLKAKMEDALPELPD